MPFSSETHVLSRNAGICGAGLRRGDAWERRLEGPRDREARATVAPRSSRCVLSFAAVLLALTSAACDPYVEGNGVYYEEDRSGSLGPFVGIHVEDGVTAAVACQATIQTVVVNGDANLVPNIRTEVQQDTIPVLHVWVDLSGGYSSTNPPTVVVGVPDLVYAYAKDRSPVSITGASTANFTADASGGAAITIVGPHEVDPAGDPAGDTVNVFASDATVDAHRYVTTNATQAATVQLTGAAHVQLHADGPVTGSASGSSTLDNLLGTGFCDAVVVSGGADVACNTPPAP